ncbi:hypothetical protein [Nonomuraea rhodomycinica]|uniref:Uncharacterized protein n=1 Tax=Nonomuraea rhodomycinica TaxID=1712872 RepID=A0A7Y6IND5_9ACTN|nr:hypothetical protein [Nonomuraea rhodomycinica]NUW41136.1 hypothetical protein [Nonomuraea rhodomycinica]
MTILSWAAGMITVLVAAMPVTRERLNRFAALAGLSVTPDNARQIIDHFAGLRRQRLISVALAALVTGLTHDPFYLVVGWSAIPVLHAIRLPPTEGERIYRTAWLLGSGGAVVASGFLLLNQGPTPARLAHAAIVVIVAAAVLLATARKSERPDEMGRWSARSLYLSGTAIALSGALLTPGQPIQRDPPEYAMPAQVSHSAASFTTVDSVKGPECPWFDETDAPCRWWLVNGNPFPQAAPYTIRTGGAPQRAPLVRSPDHKALVYLDRHDRRMIYQDADGIRPLTGVLADAAVPTVTFAGQSRYVALAKDNAQITDTRTGSTITILGAHQVHDVNQNGIVATTASHVLVVDHQGRTRLTLPRKDPGDTYYLHPDGTRLAAVRDAEDRVDAYAVRTGKHLSSVALTFPGDESLGTGLGWSKEGPFLVRGYLYDRVYHLDLTTGKLWRRKR